MDMEAGKTLTNEEVIRELLDLLKKNAMKEQANDVFEICSYVDGLEKKIDSMTEELTNMQNQIKEMQEDTLVISRGEYMAFGMQGKNIREHLPEITPSAMTRIFKRLRLHGLIEKIPGSYKYLITALGKEIIAAGLNVKNLILVPALAS